MYSSQAIKQSMNAERLDLFVTPVWIFRSAITDTHLAALRELVKKERSEFEGVVKSNSKGTSFHSRMGFAGAFKDLPGAREIGTAVMSVCEEQGMALDKCRIGYWSIITSTYGYNKRHHHGDAQLSAVLYIDTPTDGGDLIFSDTRYGSHSAPKFPRDGSKFVVAPEPKMLVVFPGYLEHEVGQNMSDQDRVIWSFNFIPVG